MIAPFCFFAWFHDTVDSLLKHPDVRVLWHTYCGSRDRVDTDTFMDAVRHHLAADTTVDPAAVLDLLSGDNCTALASALDTDSSGQVRARTMGTDRSVVLAQSLARAWNKATPTCLQVQLDRSVTGVVALHDCHAGVRHRSEWHAGHGWGAAHGLAAGGSDRRTGHCRDTVSWARRVTAHAQVSEGGGCALACVASKTRGAWLLDHWRDL